MELQTYDFIIVGGGIAATTLAAAFTDNFSITSYA